MSLYLMTLAATPLLLLGSANADGRRESADKGEEVETRYRSLGPGKHELSATVRYAPSAYLEVGWRAVARRYSSQGTDLQGWHVAIGPLWAATLRLKNDALGFRAEAHPWLAVHTSFEDPVTKVKVRVPRGAEFSGTVYGTVHLSKGVSVSPGVSLMTKAARSSGRDDPNASFWDRQTGVRFLLPMRLGVNRKLKIETGYTYLRKRNQGEYFGPERWTVACSWAF